jgi:hypothetical protein
MELYTSYSDMMGGAMKKKSSKIGKYSKLRAKLLNEGYSATEAKRMAHAEVFGMKSKSRKSKSRKSKSRTHRGRGEMLAGILYGGAEPKETEFEKLRKKLIKERLDYKKRDKLFSQKLAKRGIEQVMRQNKKEVALYNKLRNAALFDSAIAEKKDFEGIAKLTKLEKIAKGKKIYRELTEKGVDDELIKRYLESLGYDLSISDKGNLIIGLNKEDKDLTAEILKSLYEATPQAVLEGEGYGYGAGARPRVRHYARRHHSASGELMAGEMLAGEMLAGEMMPGGYEDEMDMEEIGGLLYGGARRRRGRKAKSRKSKSRKSRKSRKSKSRKSKYSDYSLLF